jgi:hypothetical protein
MSDLPPLPETPPGRYRHYKGGEYEVLDVVRHSETLEPLVLYTPLYNDRGLWVRPHGLFFGTLEVDGVQKRRFAPVDTAPGLQAEMAAFFDAFVLAFASLDGHRIAQRYGAPYMAVDAQGATRVLARHAEISDYFVAVVAGYRQRGVQSCRYGGLQCAPVGTQACLATVGWELLGSDGAVVQSWRESYSLVHQDGAWRVVASFDHAP